MSNKTSKFIESEELSEGFIDTALLSFAWIFAWILFLSSYSYSSVLGMDIILAFFMGAGGAGLLILWAFELKNGIKEKKKLYIKEED